MYLEAVQVNSDVVLEGILEAKFPSVCDVRSVRRSRSAWRKAATGGRLGEPSLPTAGGNSKGATRRLKPCGYGEQTEDGGDDRASKTIRGKRGAAKRRTAASGALALQSGNGTAGRRAGDWATT